MQIVGQTTRLKELAQEVTAVAIDEEKASYP